MDIKEGKIVLENETIYVYEVKPCRVIEKNNEIEEQIYSAYLYAIKMINFDYQIILRTEKMQFECIEEVLEKNSYITKNSKQKRAIREYREYLQGVTNETQILRRNIYLLIGKMNESKEKDIEEMFKTLKNIGIHIKEIKDSNEVFKLLFETINEVKGVLKYEDTKYISK